MPGTTKATIGEIKDGLAEHEQILVSSSTGALATSPSDVPALFFPKDGSVSNLKPVCVPVEATLAPTAL